MAKKDEPICSEKLITNDRARLVFAVLPAEVVGIIADRLGEATLLNGK